MPAINAKVLDLSPPDRMQLEAWLADFEENWGEDRLAVEVSRLPLPGHPLRLPALVEMVKIDLDRRWQCGRPLPLTHYLERYPELGPSESLPPDLLLTEEEARAQFVDLPTLRAHSPEQDVEPTLRECFRDVLPRIPGYEILEKLGEGGMGAVWKARHLLLSRTVALKLLSVAGGARQLDLVRFRKEAELIACLTHPNIVQIYEVGEHEAQLHLALEYVNGSNLSRRIKNTPQPSLQAASLLESLAQAVHYAHAQGVIHRDLKPANVLLTAAGVPKLADFGLARRIEEDSRLTTTGTAMGTPCYMAPEQAVGRPEDIGPATDVYGLGAVLYEMLTGRPPLQGASVLETLEQVRSREPVPISQLVPRVPRDLETICLKCLQKQPGRRYASASELAEDLRRFLDGKPILARRVGTVEKVLKWARRQPAAASLAGVSALAVMGFVALAVSLRYSADLKAARDAAEAAERKAQDLGDRIRYASEMTASHREWEEGHTEHARRLLDGLQNLVAARPGLAGFEWGYLRRLYQSERYTWREAPAQGVGGVTLSPDGRLVAVASRTAPAGGAVVALLPPDELTVREPASGRVIGRFAAGEAIGPFAFRPDARRIALASSGANRYRLLLWEFEGDKQPEAVAELPGAPACLAWSDDGGLLGAAVPVEADGQPRGGKALVWEATRWGKPRAVMEVGRGATDIAFSPDGRLLVAASAQGVTVGRTSGEVLAAFADTDTAGLVTPSLSGKSVRVGFSPDGAQVTAVNARMAIRTWSVGDGKLRQSVAPSTEGSGELAFHPQTERAALPVPGGAALWDTSTGRELFTLRGHEGLVRSLTFRQDGRQLATRGWDGTVRTWDATAPADGLLLPLLPPGNVLPHVAALSPDGRLVATGRSFPRDRGMAIITGPADCALEVREVGTGKALLQRYLGSPRSTRAWVSALAFSPDGLRLVSAGDDRDHALSVWDLADPARPPLRFEGHDAVATCLAFSPDGSRLASGTGPRAGETWQVRLWDASTGVCRAILPDATGPLETLAFSADGGWLASAGDDNIVRVCDAVTGKELGLLHGHAGQIKALAFDPLNRNRLASASEDNTIKLWDLARSVSTHTLFTRAGWAHALAFSPDGKRLASGDGDETVRLWDPDSGLELLALRLPQPPSARARTLRFSADGSQLIALSSGNLVRVWVASSSPQPRDPS